MVQRRIIYASAKRLIGILLAVYTGHGLLREIAVGSWHKLKLSFVPIRKTVLTRKSRNSRVRRLKQILPRSLPRLLLVLCRSQISISGSCTTVCPDYLAYPKISDSTTMLLSFNFKFCFPLR